MRRGPCQVLKGVRSCFFCLIIPATLSMLWMMVCLITTMQGSNVTFEQHMSDSFYKDYFKNKVFDEGDFKDIDQIETVQTLKGERVHVAIAIPFLDKLPISASEYLKTLEWILIYSTVPITFHIITNEGSITYLNTLSDLLNKTSNCDFEIDFVTLESIVEKSTERICPKLKMQKDFCDVVMGSMTPLIFPYLFPDLDHVIYVNRVLVFQDNIGLLYKILKKMMSGKEAIGMAPEQTEIYSKAFKDWQELNPTTKLGKPPPDGNPGYNPDLILLDLEKLRNSSKYSSYFDEQRLNVLVQKFVYHFFGYVPSLADILNLIAADSEDLIWNMGCEWNRLAKVSIDKDEEKFNVCKGSQRIHVWNGNPNVEKMRMEKQRLESRRFIHMPDDVMQEV